MCPICHQKPANCDCTDKDRQIYDLEMKVQKLEHQLEDTKFDVLTLMRRVHRLEEATINPIPNGTPP